MSNRNALHFYEGLPTSKHREPVDVLVCFATSEVWLRATDQHFIRLTNSALIDHYITEANVKDNLPKDMRA